MNTSPAVLAKLFKEECTIGIPHGVRQTLSGTRAGGNIDIVANLVTNHNMSVEEAIAVSERVGGWKKNSKTRQTHYDKEHLLQRGMDFNVLTDPNNPLSLYNFSHITTSTTTAHGYEQVRNYHTHLTIVKISNSSLCSSRHQSYVQMSPSSP